MSDESHVKLPLLPTGKPHISFSELATWLDCSFKHKLAYVDGLGTFTGNEHTIFGTHVHTGCEEFMNTREMPVDMVLEKISASWDKHKFPDKDEWIGQARGILEELPGWMDETFVGWESVAAEQLLYESLDHIGHPDAKWKGLVDAVIRHKDSRGKEIVRIIDWKTTGWGWRVKKLRDFKTNAQAAAYKLFWARKFDMDLKDTRAAFVLLKRTAKAGARCQLVEVSVGPKMEEKVNNAIDTMLRAVKVGHVVKNRLSCRFCEFNATQHCPGLGPM